ncbi:uncharacterized protein BDR25DRAFT_318859 [Lindgomyces ingoldianus]|uniref:Uncharacterized protein n=1 Tax=Lindgomyces ingoldianus TaxID=673940 RepID=A0ACB6QD94_9PLEO|nr:uncharacterized protein BDR25DRAFT_318859 [Lindgomyces ingoldianus]KAF2464867.1 hypothetical protein BDR25DRAFT_318859 [Lindgomyces ingoldianus]
MSNPPKRKFEKEAVRLRALPRRKSILNQNALHLLSLLLLTSLFAITIWFSQLTFPTNDERKSSDHQHQTRVPFSSALTVLRFLQGLTSTCTTFVLLQTFEMLEWTLASRNGGLMLLNFLSLSPTTGFLGILWLLLKKSVPRQGRIYSCWSHLEESFFFPFVGLRGFCSLTVYEAGETFNATAGTGLFDGSYVAPMLAVMNGRITYPILSMSTSFLENSEFSIAATPIHCGGENCEAYLIPGSLPAMSPNPPANNTDPLVTIYRTPAVQVEFQKAMTTVAMDSSTSCSDFGDEEHGVKLCLRSNPVTLLVEIGIVACPYGILNGTCTNGPLDKGPAFNLSTTLSVLTRRATTTCVRSNKTIVSVSDLTNTRFRELGVKDVEALHLAMNWLLNHTAAGLPFPSSPTWLFWNREGLGGNVYDWSIETYQALKSMMAYILWEFSVNNWGNPRMANATQLPDGQVEFLPAEFHTTAATVRPLTKFVLDRRMFALYIIFQSLPVLFSWAAAAWMLYIRLPRPELSSFPLMDLVFKSSFVGCPIQDSESLVDGEEKDFIKSLHGVRVVSKGQESEPRSNFGESENV